MAALVNLLSSLPELNGYVEISPYEKKETEQKVLHDKTYANFFISSEPSPLLYTTNDLDFSLGSVVKICPMEGQNQVLTDDYLLELGSYLKGFGALKEPAKTPLKNAGSHSPGYNPIIFPCEKDCVVFTIQKLQNLGPGQTGEIKCTYPALILRAPHCEKDKHQVLPLLLTIDTDKDYPSCSLCQKDLHGYAEGICLTEVNPQVALVRAQAQQANVDVIGQIEITQKVVLDSLGFLSLYKGITKDGESSTRQPLLLGKIHQNQFNVL